MKRGPDLQINLRPPADLPEALPVLCIRQGFLLPGMVSPFTIGRPSSLSALDAAHEGWVLVALQREPVADPAPSDLLPVALMARVVQTLGRQGNMRAVAIQGVSRVWLREVLSTEPHFVARYEHVEEVWPDTAEAEGVRRALFASVSQVIETLDADAPIRALSQRVESPSVLADLAGALVESAIEWKHEVLLTIDPLERAERVMAQLTRVHEALEAQKRIESKVRTELEGNQREVILRKQLKAIQEELGEGDESSDVEVLKQRLAELPLPEEVRSTVNREVGRLGRMQGGPERNVAIDWLQWIADLPWGKTTATDLDLELLERTLDESHFGLDDVKRQVLEHLAVRKLAGSGRADVLLLLGPPGVGKTSIATAIADATGRKLVRVALGGMRDEAELRGHRRTYVGARPGRLAEGIRRAGAADPVVLLDEVDKLGRGYQGDPGAALLEILDPEQNHAFVDHYLEVPFDLSKVLFIATANDLSTVPAPLRDRLEILEIEGYTPDDKVRIARGHVLKKLAQNAGVAESDVVLTDAALRAAVEGWTREAGVRQLQRALGKVYRAAAVKKAKGDLAEPLKVDAGELEQYLGRRKVREEVHEATDRPGVATGLAWTPMGGDVLFVEASRTPGNGRLVLTGQLGDVMKESAQAALTYVRGLGGAIGEGAGDLKDTDVHLHVPAGATPKDGPSAGVTMATALASLFTGRKVKGDVAMTGEITLRGRVLPVGGIKSKVLAAHARGLTTVIVPKGNGPDLEDVPESVRSSLRFVLAADLETVLDAALEK
ncbi:MAG: endopeptidase La [Myxococcales bacterium]|nr:endopeptidase La [Myxococcales bacterium]